MKLNNNELFFLAYLKSFFDREEAFESLPSRIKKSFIEKGVWCEKTKEIQPEEKWKQVQQN